MLAPLLMVPAPCPLHLRPGGGARPALRPGEPPPPRAGPTATRRCGRRQRGRGAAGVAAEEEPALSPAHPPAAPRAGDPEAPRCPGASRLPPCAAAQGPAPLPPPFRVRPSVCPPVRPHARSGLSRSRARAGHRASRGTAHTRCRPPPTGSSAAATPRSPAPPLGHAPPARSRPSRLPGGLHPSSQRVMTQHVVTPRLIPLPERFWVWGGCSACTCFPA